MWLGCPYITHRGSLVATEGVTLITGNRSDVCCMSASARERHRRGHRVAGCVDPALEAPALWSLDQNVAIEAAFPDRRFSGRFPDADVELVRPPDGSLRRRFDVQVGEPATQAVFDLGRKLREVFRS